jgi:putative transposase
MPERLRRLEQVYAERPVYFITTRLAPGLRLLATPQSHETFRDFAHRGITRGCAVGRYVLMPDHLHLFVALAPLPETPSLSQWMRSLQRTLGKPWAEAGIAAPHWQKGFFDHVVRSSDSGGAKWRYVADNPVAAGLAKHADDWPYAGEVVHLGF